ncbi:MAG: hypothetical protein ACTSX9_09055 [Candidatus Njordarchaeales archaeon]
MVGVRELRKIVKEGTPPYRLTYEQGGESGEEELNSAKDVMDRLRELFGGSLRGVKIEIIERNSTTEILVYKVRGPRAHLVFKRHKQLSIMSFFQ